MCSQEFSPYRPLPPDYPRFVQRPIWVGADQLGRVLCDVPRCGSLSTCVGIIQHTPEPESEERCFVCEMHRQIPALIPNRWDLTD